MFQVRLTAAYRWLGWFILPAMAILGVAWWLLDSDDTIIAESLPAAYAPKENATPVLVLSGPLSGASVGLFAKPVVAAARDGEVMIVAMSQAAGDGMNLVRWQLTKGGTNSVGPTSFENNPAQCDFLADPWLVTDQRNRLHLVHLATRMQDRNACPCIYRRSVDGGKTWPLTKRIAEGVDRPVLGVSPNGQRLAIVCMMGDAKAPPLTSAELQNPALATAATNRVMTQGVFHSANRGNTWKRLSAPSEIRHSVPFATVIDDDGRIAAVWVSNDGNGSRSVLGTTTDFGTTWSMTVLVESLQPDRPHPFNGGRFPVLALDASKRLHALFVEAGGKGLLIRNSADWANWSEPIRLSANSVAEVRNPAIAAAGEVVHAIWMERKGDRYHMHHRASKDGGVRWSDTLTLSRPNAGSSALTEDGFHLIGDDDQASIADAGDGTWHAVRAAGGRGGEFVIWHAAGAWQVPKKP